MPQALPPDAAPVVTAAAIPVVTVSFAVPDLTVNSFTPDLQQALIDSIAATLPANANTQIYLTNLRDGSLLFDTVVLFLDGNTNAAQALTATAAAVRSSSFTLTVHYGFLLYFSMRFASTLHHGHCSQLSPSLSFKQPSC